MVVHHKQIQRKRNRERETERYKRKREKRAYLTEAFNDGELDLYKPTQQPRYNHNEAVKTAEQLYYPIEYGLGEPKEITIHSPRYSPPVKFNWFEKFLLWIKKWWNNGE